MSTSLLEAKGIEVQPAIRVAVLGGTPSIAFYGWWNFDL